MSNKALSSSGFSLKVIKKRVPKIIRAPSYILRKVIT